MALLLCSAALASPAASPQRAVVVLDAHAELRRGVPESGDARASVVHERLRTTASSSQDALLQALPGLGVRLQRRFVVVNAIAVEGSAGQLAELARRADVAAVVLDRPMPVQLPDTEALQPVPAAVEASLALIGVPQVWALGFRGAGVTVASQDTGVQWDHPALRSSYRGSEGGNVSHAYHWHDAIHAANASCAADSAAPCDDNSHGTHTVGTMVGEDGANQVGVAPAARWVACRNMNAGNGTPATYLECMDWMLAPTDAAGQNPRPDLAPHIINNSWGCPPVEGCDPAAIALLQAAVDNLRAAGVLFVSAAGNSGASGCGSVSDPPGIYASSVTVGNTRFNDTINGSSSRGPVTVDGSNRLKPDLSAPGTSIRSTVPGGLYGSKTGTSMASPHVAGVAALLMSAEPALQRNPEQVEAILKQATVQIASSQTCGGIAPTTFPNPVVGHGRIDALRAVQLATGVVMKNGFE